MNLLEHELHCLATLGETLHFGRAAQRLGRAPSAVSRILKGAEQRLGTELVVRSSRGVWLTPAGEEMLLHARRILTRLEAVSVAVACRGISGTTQVARTVSLEPGVSPVALSAFLEQMASAGRVGPPVVTAISGRQFAPEQVMSGEFVAHLGSGRVESAGLSSHLLHSYRLGLLVAARSGVEMQDSADALRGRTLLVPAALETRVRHWSALHGLVVTTWPDDDATRAASLALSGDAVVLARDPRYGGRDAIFADPVFAALPVQVPDLDDVLTVVWPDEAPLLDAKGLDELRGSLSGGQPGRHPV